ncbi:MAG: hypothetical protein ACLSB9_07455 [Hydrogeniiclostridium mannosilyticum]
MSDIINHEGKTLCMNCMSELDGKEACPNCGYPANESKGATRCLFILGCKGVTSLAVRKTVTARGLPILVTTRY